MSDRRIELLSNGKVHKAVNYMMLPATLGLLVNGLYNIVDTMFVAWLGTSATGATQVVMPIMVLISAFGLCLGIGGGSYISRLLGMKDYEKANQVGSTLLMTAILFGTTLSIAMLIFLEPILKIFGANDATLVYSKSYGIYIVIAAVFTITNITLNNLLRAEGSAKLSMIGQGLGAIINIILDPLLIYTLGMGISGAGLATLIARIGTTIILISRYVSNKSVIRLSRHHIKPSLDMYIEVLRIGISTFFRQLFYSISIGIMNRASVNYGGPALLAATGILLRISLLINFLIFGIAQGMQPVIGYNYGAGNWARIRQAFRYSMTISIASAVTLASLLMGFDQAVLSIFKPASDVMQYGIIGVKFYALTFILMSIINIITSFYQAIGKPVESLLLSISRQGVLFIPAILLLPLRYGALGILGAQLAADILTIIMTLFLFRPYFRLFLSRVFRETDIPIGAHHAQENTI